MVAKFIYNKVCKGYARMGDANTNPFFGKIISKSCGFHYNLHLHHLFWPVVNKDGQYINCMYIDVRGSDYVPQPKAFGADPVGGGVRVAHCLHSIF